MKPLPLSLVKPHSREHIVSEGAFFNNSKIHKTSHQYQKLYSAHHDMVHIPAKFLGNTALRLRVAVRKRNVTDRQTDRQTEGRMDGVRCSISRPGHSGQREIINTKGR